MNNLKSGIALLVILLVISGCTSTPNDGAPLADQSHPAGWLADHGSEALADLQSCQLCHGNDYSGGTVGVSCYSCHLSGPPFIIHPAGWGSEVVANHQNFALEMSWTTCGTSGCHGEDLQGGSAGAGIESGPSCFTLVGCHSTPNGGPPAPGTHTLTYDEPADHGPAAKQNQAYCLNCHGRPDNIFDGGFVTPNYGGVGNCSLCHPHAQAHPTDWQGNNDTNANGYSATHWGVTAEAINVSCALCHNVIASYPPSPIASAPTCYAAGFENGNNQGAVSCHAAGPGGHPTTAFAWEGSCSTCHADGGLGIVAGVHNNNCLNCHVSDTDRTRRVGTNGDATLAEALTDPETATCLTCHDPVIYPTQAFHHLLPSFVSRDCVDCHGSDVGHAVSFNASTDLSAGSPCSDLACHSGQVENWTNITSRHDQYDGNGALVCDTCHKSLAQTSRSGLYNENRTIEDVIFDAMNGGTTVNCLECHLDRQDYHSGHNASVFSFGADGCDAAGCHDATRYAVSGTPEVVNDVHAAVCTTCHATSAGGLGTTIIGDATNGVDGDATLAAGASYASATCLTCHPAATYPATAIHHDHPEYLANNCTFCHSGGAPGHGGDFAASSDGCDACHNQALYGSAGIPDVVTDIHGSQCTLCHAAAAGSASNEILGVNGDGDATQADGTAAAGSWASVTCLTCHGTGAGVNAIPDVHHDATSAGAGPVAAVAGDCTYCHADPRPAVNTANGLGSPVAMTVTILSCSECHVAGGNIYQNSYTPTTTNASGGTAATNFATVQQTLMNGVNPGTVNHSFAATIQNYGACLTCHLNNVTTIYGTSSVKVNVFHARPLDWAKDGNDTNDNGANDQVEVLRGAPGRETFRVFGNDLNYWPLGDLRGQGWRLCGSATRTYENCTNNQIRWRDLGVDANRGGWDNPVLGFDQRMTIPCGNWNDDGARNYCNGASQDVPRF